MCGITGIISKNNSYIINVLINSLSMIENRGYDSVGICSVDYLNKFNIVKTLDNSKDLKSKINDNNTYKLAIGHTRWATHGGVTTKNCHPHISMNNLVIIVHNGIINNYKTLKKILIENDYKFYSDTDSEVIANYIEYLIIKKNYSIKEAINNLSHILDGTWALLILYLNENDTIYATRKGSPLLLAESDDYIMLASENSGFLNMFNNYISLKTNDIIKITNRGYESNFNYNIYNLNKIDYNITPYPYEHWLLKEINDQPACIMNAINNGGRIKNNKIKLGGLNLLKETLNKKKFNHLLVFGCGTSYHVAMMTRYYFQNNNFQSIQFIDASEFYEVDLPNINDNCLAIFCSQSGETYDIINCLKVCKTRNYFTIGVINVVDSYIARSVHCGVYMNSGKEVSVASTKSFVNSLVILSMIGMWFNDENYNIDKITILRNLNNNVTNMLHNFEVNQKIETTSNFIIENNINSIFLLGTKELFPVAKEGALKLKEITYLHAEAYSALTLKHGPFAILDKNNITFLLIQCSESKRLMSTYNEIISRNTNCFIVTDDNNLDLKNKDNIIFIENLIFYKEILFIIFFQKLSYDLAIKKNINPDKPKNLAKVVTVE